MTQFSLPSQTTGRLLLASGEMFEAFGMGATGVCFGELCFNTAMTGHEEILSDPSYTGQIILFTFPHVGNVGANARDSESVSPRAHQGIRGLVVRNKPTPPANWRSDIAFEDWLAARGLIGLWGVDTRALTGLIRDKGMPNVALAHQPDGLFDVAALREGLSHFAGIEGQDLVPQVTGSDPLVWTLEDSWTDLLGSEAWREANRGLHIVVLDYGVKRNILNLLAGTGCRVTLAPATISYDDLMALSPDGVFLSNGPGDPAETGLYAVPLIRRLLDRGLPLFGICLGHQLLALALGGRTIKMHQGHHGANHPVQDLRSQKVEIVSMNHGSAVDAKSLPSSVTQTHLSLFDGSNCGLTLAEGRAFSVQYHPEASPGPRDSHYLFEQFVETIRRARSNQVR